MIYPTHRFLSKSYEKIRREKFPGAAVPGGPFRGFGAADPIGAQGSAPLPPGSPRRPLAFFLAGSRCGPSFCAPPKTANFDCCLSFLSLLPLSLFFFNVIIIIILLWWVILIFLPFFLSIFLPPEGDADVSNKEIEAFGSLPGTAGVERPLPTSLALLPPRKPRAGAASSPAPPGLDRGDVPGRTCPVTLPQPGCTVGAVPAASPARPPPVRPRYAPERSGDHDTTRPREGAAKSRPLPPGGLGPLCPAVTLTKPCLSEMLLVSLSL